MLISLLRSKIKKKYILIIILGLFVAYKCFYCVRDRIIKSTVEKALNGDSVAQRKVGRMLYGGKKLFAKKHDAVLEWYLKKIANQDDTKIQKGTDSFYDAVYHAYIKVIGLYFKAANGDINAQNEIAIIENSKKHSL